MTNLQDIVEKLSLFNNMSFTKKQWDIILKGCGCPKSTHLWSALCKKNIQKDKRIYTLIDINAESFHSVWEEYCNVNRASANKAYKKKKAYQRARERAESCKGITFYMIGGVLTTEKPERE